MAKAADDALLVHVGHHLLGRVRVAAQVAIGSLAAVPVRPWEERTPTAVLFRKILLVAAVGKIHDMAVAIRDEHPVAHEALLSTAARPPTPQRVYRKPSPSAPENSDRSHDDHRQPAMDLWRLDLVQADPGAYSFNTERSPRDTEFGR